MINVVAAVIVTALVVAGTGSNLSGLLTFFFILGVFEAMDSSANEEDTPRPIKKRRKGGILTK